MPIRTMISAKPSTIGSAGGAAALNSSARRGLRWNTFVPLLLHRRRLLAGSAAACAEVQKFLTPCGGQLCPSFRLVMTPPDGWVLDVPATKENDVQIMVPKGKTFAMPSR